MAQTRLTSAQSRRLWERVIKLSSEIARGEGDERSMHWLEHSCSLLNTTVERELRSARHELGIDD